MGNSGGWLEVLIKTGIGEAGLSGRTGVWD